MVTYLEKDPLRNKIEMIKSLRMLTIVLGRLGIRCLRKEHSDYRRNISPFTNPNRSPQFDKIFSYGLGLKNSKDITERYLDRKARSTSA